MLYLLLANGFEEVEALGTVDFLRRCGLNVLMGSITGRRMVTGTHQIPVMADCLLRHSNIGNSDGIILPGGMPGAENLRKNNTVERSVRTLFDTNKLVAAICAAPMVLGHCGILNGRNATCYPGFETWLHGANVCKEQNVVEDGNIITARGPAFTFQFAAAIARRFVNEDVVNQVTQGMLFQ